MTKTVSLPDRQGCSHLRAAYRRPIDGEVDLELREAASYFEAYRNRELEGVGALSGGATRLGFSNLNTFSNRQAPYGRGNAELDEIVGRALAAVTEADQAALSREGHLYAMEHQFSISLPWINSAWASRKDAIAEWQPVAASASPNSFETMRGPETA